MVSMIESLFGFEARQVQDAVRSFYGPAYEAIKRADEEWLRMDRLIRRTENDRIDEVAHQITKS